MYPYILRLRRFWFSLTAVFYISALFLSIVSRAAEVALVVPGPHDAVGIKMWEDRVQQGFHSGDVLSIDGKRYELGPELRSGEGGRVHLLAGFNPKRIIKIQRRIFHSLMNRYLKTEVESLNELAKIGVSVPQLFEVPKHKLYLVKEYGEGEVVDSYFMSAKNHSVTDIVRRVKLIAELLSKLEHGGLFFDDLHSGNLLFAGESGDTLFVFDPGALQVEAPFKPDVMNSRFFGSNPIPVIVLRMFRFFMQQTNALMVTAGVEDKIIRLLTHDPHLTLVEHISMMVWGGTNDSPADEPLVQHLQNFTDIERFLRTPGFNAALYSIFGTSSFDANTILNILNSPSLTLAKIKLLRSLISTSVYQDQELRLKIQELMLQKAIELDPNKDVCRLALDSK